MAILCRSFSLQNARLYLTQSNFFRKFCLKRLSLQSLNSAICVKFLRFVMLRKRIEVVTKKVLKLLCNFAVPLRASLMILVSWSSGRISISKLVCVTTANLLIISYLTKFQNACFRSLRLLFPSILRIVVYGCLTGVQVPVRGAVYTT